MKYVISGAVMTGHGVWEYRPTTISEVKRWLREGGWVSAVKYPATAEILRRLTGVSIPLSDRKVVLRPGDEALVFRLKYESPNTHRFLPSLSKIIKNPRLQKECVELGFLRLIKEFSREGGTR